MSPQSTVPSDPFADRRHLFRIFFWLGLAGALFVLAVVVAMLD